MLKKCHDRAGIIFCQTFGFKYADYLERTDRSAVNPGGGHCLVHIGNHNNLGKAVDLIALDTERISRAIAALMVHHCRHLHMDICLLGAKDIVAAQRVGHQRFVFGIA